MLLIFQSHIGAIRSFKLSAKFCRLCPFQSHIGAIRSYAAFRVVRISCLFQSHIGAIRSEDEDAEDTAERENFNPTLVQLEVIFRNSLSDKGFISIPHWCN